MYQENINLSFEEVLDSAKIGIVVLSAKCTINMMNVGLSNIFGYEREDLTKKPINKLFQLDEYKTLQKYMKNADYLNNVFPIPKYELYGFRKDKTTIPLEINILKSYKGQNNIYILIIREIVELKKTVDDLTYLAYYDQLTRIPNRTLFRDRAETALRQARRSEEKIAILYIDIDEFKLINDKFGHAAGDTLLRELSKRFERCIRDSDTVSRVGGDEFTILMLKIGCYEDVSIVVERLFESNLSPVKINNQNIIPKISVGISIFPNDGENIEILLKNADAAMYRAKEKGKNQFVFYKGKSKKNIV